MTEDEKHPVIRIIVKKKQAHGGAHGGAWKVAYADFVTAMMALFIVLWIVGQNQNIKKAVGGYFRDPTAVQAVTTGGSGILPDSAPAGSQPDTQLQAKPGATEVQTLKTEGEKLAQAISSTKAFDKFKDKVQISVTKEGLRIELIENSEGLFFDIGSAGLKGEASQLLRLVATKIGKLPNNVVIEGHTDARPYSGKGYSNWELSTERANSARKILEDGGLRNNQVKGVHGYADRQLKQPAKPLDFSNRRIAILVAFSTYGQTPADKDKPAAVTEK